MLRCAELPAGAIAAFLRRCRLRQRPVATDAPIPGSYWGEPEAGLIGDRLYFRPDTPVHSLLHEACHYICATPERRSALDTDAGGDDLEESAVCYLQVLLWDRLTRAPRATLFRDMDAWGYSFRLGGARRWFEEDADDARRWLRREGILTAAGPRLGYLRGENREINKENSSLGLAGWRGASLL